MRNYIFILSLLVVSYSGFSQKDTTVNNVEYEMLILEGDTTWVFVLNEYEMVESDWRYRSMIRKFKRVYPYAVTAVEVLSDLGEEDSEKISRQTKKEARKKKRELKKDFREAILDMSESEGNILCKLIYIKTGMTAFDIIKKYRGGVKAAYWQTISRLGGANLKQTFDPNADILLNRVLEDYYAGQFSIDDE